MPAKIARLSAVRRSCPDYCSFFWGPGQTFGNAWGARRAPYAWWKQLGRVWLDENEYVDPVDRKRCWRAPSKGMVADSIRISYMSRGLRDLTRRHRKVTSVCRRRSGFRRRVRTVMRRSTGSTAKKAGVHPGDLILAIGPKWGLPGAGVESMRQRRGGRQPRVLTIRRAARTSFCIDAHAAK